MRILYLSQSYVPSRRADSVQVMKMCAALARQGHEVELVTKRCASRQEPGVTDEHGFYGVERSFAVTPLPRPAPRGGGLLYAAAVSRHLWRRRRQVELVFSRDLWGAWLAGRLGLPFRYEAHGVPRGRLARSLFSSFTNAPSFRGLVAITRGLLEELSQRGLWRGERAVLAPDGADPPPAEVPPAAEPRLALRPGRFHVGYAGHLYPGRGIGLIAELARRLPECDFHVVGGHDDAVAEWRRRAPAANLFFHGFLPPRDLPAVYPLFDVLLMPHRRQVGAQSGRTDIARWMSPMKMFEYMAAGRPILASDLPVLREVLAEGRNCLLLPPSDVAAWEAALSQLRSDPSLGRRLGDAAQNELRDRYTWDARARKVLRDL